MKIISLVFRVLNWLLCLALRCMAWTSNRLHQKLQSGPSARLWAASDEELLMEIRKRGLLTMTVKAKAVEAVQTRFLAREEEAALVVKKLQQCPAATAREAVNKALLEMKGKSWMVQDLVTAAIKYA